MADLHNQLSDDNVHAVYSGVLNNADAGKCSDVVAIIAALPSVEAARVVAAVCLRFQDNYIDSAARVFVKRLQNALSA